MGINNYRIINIFEIILTTKNVTTIKIYNRVYCFFIEGCFKNTFINMLSQD